ncbi:hypothetical protein [Mucilaginibacter ginsenosidivorans]|uniref:Carboxypeptidase-like regulatory domain-containing protein n=1 Tax=Mucilaginibacter ginsenosidivorans TaxID=398053 RepID=A0A5B8UQE9_9SPHI|nr:hypothetical protein [Mucilaginibacter ginsenosidivorans]QEC61244.1 hypothetical protein FRZ54_01160 [Mucilaginibacter ginsenosidivorans]
MLLRLKIIFVLTGLFGLWNISLAQQTITIRGVIFRKSSTERVSQVLINDLNNKNIMMSDDLGMFSINTAIYDTLLITKKGFTPIKITVQSKDDLSLYLQPVVELNQVTIKGETKKEELNDVMKQYRSQGIFYDGKSLPVLAFLNSPLTGFYNLFGKKPREARHFAAYAKTELENNEIDRRYTKSLVQSVTKLPDDEVTKFMQVYTPSYQDIMQWNDYQLITYIKKNFAFYKKHKDQPSQQLQKLN